MDTNFKQCPKGVYIVYGEYENREFLSHIDVCRKSEIRGVAVKVNTPEEKFYLVRGLTYGTCDAWNLSHTSKKMDGDIAPWPILSNMRRELREVSSTLRKTGVDIDDLKDCHHWYDSLFGSLAALRGGGDIVFYCEDYRVYLLSVWLAQVNE